MANGSQLQRLLEMWEEVCWRIRVRWLLQKKRQQFVAAFSGGLAKFSQLKRDIFNTPLGCDVDRLWQSYRLPVEEEFLNAVYCTIPFFLLRLVADSRRVFEPSPEAVSQMASMNLEGFRWRDVHWPSGSFAIQLGSPIANDVNFIIATLGDQKLITLCVTGGVESFTPSTSHKRERVERLIRQGRLAEAEAQLTTAADLPSIGHISVSVGGPDQLLTEALRRSFLLGDQEHRRHRAMVDEVASTSSESMGIPSVVRQLRSPGGRELAHGTQAAGRGAYEALARIPIALALYLPPGLCGPSSRRVRSPRSFPDIIETVSVGAATHAA